jgi:hypothetical protein
MWRNIIGVSIYQLTVCLVFMFAGADLLDIKCPTVAATATAAAYEDCHHRDLELNGFIFNAFVIMQVFSEINSRRIADINVFAKISESPIFCGILVLTIGVQVLFIEAVGGTVVGPAIGFVSQNAKEWITAFILGIVILPVGFVTRQLPLEWFPGETDEESNARAMEDAKTRIAAAQSRADAATLGVESTISIPTSDEKKQVSVLSGFSETIVSSRLHARQSRLSDASESTMSDFGAPKNKSFKVFAHAIIATNRLNNALSTNKR